MNFEYQSLPLAFTRKKEVKSDKGGEGGKKTVGEVRSRGGRGKEGKRYIARRGGSRRNCRG